MREEAEMRGEGKNWDVGVKKSAMQSFEEEVS